MKLKGKKTAAGWEICDSVQFGSDHTGGYFSDCYQVQRDGQKAFLKALDIEKFDISNIMGLLAGFGYEKELLELCKSKGLSRVVQVLESGQIEVDPNAPPVLRNVPFMIFELAQGDVRDGLDVSRATSDSFRFRVLHQTTLALMQLHKEYIAHQDLKPSNVLDFGAETFKLGDLGRSSQRGRQAPHDGLSIAGAKNYAPFEQRYGYLSSDWITRRLSVDVFNLGCLVVFAFTNISFPAYVMQKVADPYQPENWGGTYEQVLDHIQAALVESLVDISQDFPKEYRDDLVDIVVELCDPRPEARGRRGKGLVSTPDALWLQRYVSRFDMLEKRSRLKRRI